MSTNNHILVSFIIPCFNVKKYIEICIRSIQNQSYSNIEIIAVNDGSPDGTLDILNRMAQNDSRIKIVNKDNGGVSSARNAGIEACSGDYIIFVDGDDYIANDYTDYMLGMALKYDADMALSQNCYMSDGEMQIKKDSIIKLSPEEGTCLLIGPRVTVGSWNKIYKRSLIFDNNLRFSTTQFYGEGLIFITSATQRANCVVVGNRKVYYYRRNNYSSACTKFKIANFYNGWKSLDIIEENLIIRTSRIIQMLDLHRCLFKMGTVVRIREAGQVSDYKQYYLDSLAYVRKHAFKCYFIKGVSLYKKGIILGTCISPSMMAFLDIIRRNRIQKQSV